MEEKFSIPGVGAIIEKREKGTVSILVQERVKDRPHEGSDKEIGLLEIPAGKINEYESVYSCLRREVLEETGFIVDTIEGEDQAEVVEVNGYKVLNYTPFSNSQNIKGYYPIMVQVFICTVKGTPSADFVSSESKNIRWEKLDDLKKLLKNTSKFYPMHIATLNKYLELRG